MSRPIIVLEDKEAILSIVFTMATEVQANRVVSQHVLEPSECAKHLLHLYTVACVTEAFNCAAELL